MDMQGITIVTIITELVIPIVIDMVAIIMAYLMLMDVTSHMDTIGIQETIAIITAVPHSKSGSFENTTSL